MTKQQPDGKHPMTIRLSADGRRLLAEVAQKMGTSKTSVLEWAIREFAKQRGVE